MTDCTHDRPVCAGPRGCPDLPDLGYNQTAVMLRPDWTCRKCGRVWRQSVGASGGQWWVEIGGPR